ncbi:MAG: hypothetical protein HYX69_03775 [Planctomycetia bacterium]|nr:hypothetical protein [Planctomycetia bacterium]
MTDERQAKTPPDPSYSAVVKYLRYGLSLPERALRSGSAVAAGAVRESAALLVPQAFQNSKTYSVMVQQMLDFMAEDVGGVARKDAAGAGPKVENFVARKAIGNFVEMAGLATLHLSPLMLLAAVSDIAYGSQTYLKELADELREQGVIDEASAIHHVDDLLTAVAAASGATASAFDTPPLSVDGLRESIAQTREALRSIDPASVIPQAEIARVWNEVRDIAGREGVSRLEVSGAMTLYTLGRMKTVARGALSGVRVAGRLFDRHVIDHYEEALAEIRGRGLYVMLRESSAPYIEAVWQNFATSKTTVTEDLLSGKLLGHGWNAVRKWLGGRGETQRPPSQSGEQS